MKKKTMVWAYLIILSLGTILSLYIPKNEVAAKDAIVIPGQAIRLRILANSDLDSDQALKRKVRDAVNAKISVWVKDLTSIQEARKVIKSKLPEIKETAEEVVKDEGSKQKVNVKFGKVQFPTKLYGQFLYPAGDYEAILITLGKGEGANWWCVLFPPLCFLDFSNGIAVSKGFDEKSQKAESRSEQPAAQTEQVAEAKEEPTADVEIADNDQADDEVQATDNHTAKAEAVKREVSNVKSAVKTQVKTAVKAQVQTAVKKAAHVPNLGEKEMEADETQSTEALDSSASDSENDYSAKQDKKQKAPVYTSQDEEPVKVKFFIVELWDKIF